MDYIKTIKCNTHNLLNIPINTIDINEQNSEQYKLRIAILHNYKHTVLELFDLSKHCIEFTSKNKADALLNQLEWFGRMHYDERYIEFTDYLISLFNESNDTKIQQKICCAMTAALYDHCIERDEIFKKIPKKLKKMIKEHIKAVDEDDKLHQLGITNTLIDIINS